MKLILQNYQINKLAGMVTHDRPLVQFDEHLFDLPLDFQKILEFYRDFNLPDEKTDFLLHEVMAHVNEKNLSIAIGCFRNMQRSLVRAYPNFILDLLNRVANVQIDKNFAKEYLVRITKLIRKNLTEFSEEQLEEVASILENFRKFDRLVFRTVQFIKNRRLNIQDAEDSNLL